MPQRSVLSTQYNNKTLYYLLNVDLNEVVVNFVSK